MHLTKKMSAIVIFFIAFILHAQSIESIEKQLEEARRLSTEDASRSISLYNKILEESQKIKFDKGILISKSALATIYFNNGEYGKVIESSGDVEALALKLNDFGELAGIYRNVAASYSMLRLNKQALQTLDKAKIYAGKIGDNTVRHYTTALIYDSYSVCIGMANQDLAKMIYYINKSIEELEKISDKEEQAYIEAKYDLIGFQYFRLADLYFRDLKQNSKASEYYQKALKIYEDPRYNILPNNKVILYSSLSDFQYVQKDFEKSIIYGKKALEFTRKYDQPEIRKDIYNTLFKAYLDIGQKDESKHYADMYTELNDSLKHIERSSVNTSLEKIIAKKESTYNQSLKIILIILGFVIILSVILFFFWRRKNKFIHKKYEELIDWLKKENLKEAIIGDESEIEQEIEPDNDFPTSEKLLQITDSTVNTILLKLEKFEKSDKYLKNEINLPYLASQLGTNTKYLSEIIKQHKGKSFSNYINGLRINYIVTLLYKEPKYREYKISYLAELCGFSSREVFAVVFKKETGISPSYFISNLKDNMFSNDSL